MPIWDSYVHFPKFPLFSRQFYRYIFFFFKKKEWTKIFALINIILMNGIDSKLHFHIFHSFSTHSSGIVPNHICFHIFPLEHFSCFISLLFRFISIYIFLLHYSHLVPFYKPHSTFKRTYTQFPHSYLCIALSYDLQQLPKNKVHKKLWEAQFSNNWDMWSIHDLL